MQPRTVSASSLANWEDCPAKFVAVNIERVPEQGKKVAANIGSSVHYALEHFVDRVHIRKVARWSDKQLLDDLLVTGWKSIFGTADTKTPEFKDAQAMVDTWYGRTDLSGTEVVSTEVKKQHILPASSGEIPMTYIMDRLDMESHDDGTVTFHVVDYKAVALDTPIPTPSGWTTMGEISVGDQLYAGDSGQVCRVVGKSRVKYEECYEVTFDDGERIVCSHDHRWEVNVAGRRRVMDARQMREHLGVPRAQRNLSVSHSPVHAEEDAPLPIDPYVFGAWIGDGSSTDGSICKPHLPLFEEIERRGYAVGDPMPSRDVLTRTVKGIRAELSALMVLGDKHIPVPYLRASYTQRLDLLRGIMDTDGHWNSTRKRAVLNTTSQRYADQVRELVCSLGWTATVFPTTARGFGKEWDAWQLWFTPTGGDVFLARHPREHSNAPYVAPTSRRPFRRIVVSVEPVETVPTQCVEVDSPDHCFRVGKGFIKTHNTQRLGESFESLRNKLQAQLYATSIYMEYGKSHKIRSVWVHLDLLRHRQIGVEFTVGECRDFYLWLLEQVDLIRATPQDRAPEVVGPGCAWCPRKGACGTLRKAVTLGGAIPPDADLAQLVDTRQRLDAQMKAIKAILDEHTAAIAERMRMEDVPRLVLGEWTAEWDTGRATRVVDSARAATVLGPEIMGHVSKVSVTSLDAIIASGVLDDDKRAQVESLVRTEYGQPTVKVKKTPKPRTPTRRKP